ncbi:MAG TPA: polysaccharide deacetylase family protein [Candidatus Dormibacteraeota bacterium]|nr:polysaccharide deacetylase family protein [Candidatus Dormibacteraeota bacterium]
MGQAARYVLVLSALLLSTLYVLQTGDSPHPTAAVAATPVDVSPLLLTQADTSGHEYFLKRHEVVPLGSEAIRLPILMYHYIRTPPSMKSDMLGYRLSVAPDVFETQMDWLYAHGYHPVNFNQVRAYFAGTDALPARPVVITLDDGYRDLYTTAFPILKAHGFTAVAYIVPNFVGWPQYVTTEQVLELDRNGIEIASHTMSHANLAKMSYGSVMYELVQSKRWLEELVGHPVVDFAYPSGQFTALTVAAVQRAGYDTAVTEQVSLMHSRADRYTWARVRVGGGELLPEFIAGLGPSMPSVTITNLDVEAAAQAPAQPPAQPQAGQSLPDS